MAPSVSGSLGYISTLQEQIQDGMVTSIFQRRFLPNDKLDEIFTFDAIKNAVTELTCSPDDRIKLVDTIHNEGKKVFAMLIYRNWQNLIIDFRKHGALDNRLPFSEDEAVAITGRDIGCHLAQDIQWAFCPYIFPEKMWECHRQVEETRILPFISTEKIGLSGFSVVDKLSISPSQQNFINKKVGLLTLTTSTRLCLTYGASQAAVVQVVRKQLNVEGRTEDFRRENRNLRLLNQLRHPNIIPLWGSYTYHEEQYFLFPHIDMHLGKFLTAEARHQEFQWDFTFYSALAGLASALSKTHNRRFNQADHDADFDAIGRHHDLRPPSVLVSADTFILTDIGLGRLRGAEELSHKRYKSNTGDYIAPKSTDMNENSQIVNRAIDVWVFGYLAAEVITYMLKGAVGVQNFRTQRLTPARLANWKDSGFYQPHGHVKDEVINWMETLKHENPHPDLVPRLIEISLDALQPNPQTRPDMGVIHRRLEALSVKKHFDSVQNMFRQVQGTNEESAFVAQHHTVFRFAQERLEVWGHALALNKDNVSTHLIELPEQCVGIMKSLLSLLREESKKRSLGDGFGLLSLPIQLEIGRNVETLWKLLPGNIFRVAEKLWEESLANKGLSRQISSPHDAAHVLPPAQIFVFENILQCEFEEAVRWFKDSIPDSVNLDEVSHITSMNDVYDITDKIQTEQHEHGRLRNLQKVKIFLDRLEGYTTSIDFIIRGNRDVLVLIWGPIILLLQWSRALDKAYDSLVDAVATVGKAMPEFQSSVSIANQNIEAKEIVVLLFKDILNFYREAFRLFTHPSKCHCDFSDFECLVRLANTPCYIRLDANV